jgi:hypothetical protein
VASAFGLFGAVWQVVVAIMASNESMSSFARAHNELLKEEHDKIKAEVARWRLLGRRRRIRQARTDAHVLLTEDEARISRQYDREAIGWSSVIVATLVLTVAAWVDWLA